MAAESYCIDRPWKSRTLFYPSFWTFVVVLAGHGHGGGGRRRIHMDRSQLTPVSILQCNPSDSRRNSLRSLVGLPSSIKVIISFSVFSIIPYISSPCALHVRMCCSTSHAVASTYSTTCSTAFHTAGHDLRLIAGRGTDCDRDRDRARRRDGGGGEGAGGGGGPEPRL